MFFPACKFTNLEKGFDKGLFSVLKPARKKVNRGLNSVSKVVLVHLTIYREFQVRHYSSISALFSYDQLQSQLCHLWLKIF